MLAADPEQSALHRREEMQVKWSDSAVLKEHVHLLSPECRDLLDKIFITDPKRRITVPQIMEHPFYTQFLTDGNKVRKASTACPNQQVGSVMMQLDSASDAPWKEDAAVHGNLTTCPTPLPQTAWEKMQAEQAKLDAWRQETPIDPAKV